MAGRRSKIIKEDVVEAIAAVRAQQKLVMRLPDGSLVGAALVKAQLGRGEYGTVQRFVAEVLAEEEATPVEPTGEIVQDGLVERLKPVTDGLLRLVQQVQADAMRAAEDRVRMIEAGAEARIRAAEGLRDQALQQLAIAELAAPRIDELEAAVEKVGRDRDRALARLQELEGKLSAQKEAETAAKQEQMPLETEPKPGFTPPERPEAEPTGGLSTDAQRAKAAAMAAHLGEQISSEVYWSKTAISAWISAADTRERVVKTG